MAFNFPNSPSNGQQYTPVGGPVFTWDGTAWQSISQGIPVTVYVSDTAPSNPSPGQLWWDSSDNSGNLFISYIDADSTQWVQVNGTPAWAGTMTRTVLAGTSSSGTNGVYTKPVGLRYLEVELVGGGGGATWTPATAAGVCAASTGGGGGGYCYRLYAASEIAATTPYTIGGWGTATPDNHGTPTIWMGMTANGGNSGLATAAGSTPLTASGGAGGGAFGGLINITGGDGQRGIRAVHGSATSAMPGGGGGNFFVPGNIGRGFNSTTANANTGLFPGGGADGCSAGPNQASGVAGASGAPGCIILKEYF